MLTIASIVEGHGEVEALPILLRRIAEVVAPDSPIFVPRPIRVKRQLVVKPGELERYVQLAAARAGGEGAILILLDAEDDCPAELAVELLRRARAARADRSIRTVLAKVEYESWFIAAVESTTGQPLHAAAPPPDPESISDAKGWLSRNALSPGTTYRPTRHQARFTAAFDLDTARSAPSFDKLWRDVTSLLVPQPTSNSE